MGRENISEKAEWINNMEKEFQRLEGRPEGENIP